MSLSEIPRWGKIGAPGQSRACGRPDTQPVTADVTVTHFTVSLRLVSTGNGRAPARIETTVRSESAR